MSDIDNEIDESYIDSTYEIDRRSLGGSIKDVLRDIDLLDRSKSLKNIIRKLSTKDSNGHLRVASFWRDMDKCLYSTSSVMKENAYMVWVIGNRNVAGLQIPMDKIIIELFSHYGVIPIEKIRRSIPSKRIPSKNNFSKTMNKEIILIMRKENLSYN